MEAPIPTPRLDDDEDVHWALSTAGALWGRGERGEALKWLRRAAEQASDVNADARSLELFKAAAEVASHVASTPVTTPSVAAAPAGETPLPVPVVVQPPPSAPVTMGETPKPPAQPTHVRGPRSAESGSVPKLSHDGATPANHSPLGETPRAPAVSRASMVPLADRASQRRPPPPLPTRSGNVVPVAETPKPPAHPVTMGEVPKPPAQAVTMGETPKPPAQPAVQPVPPPPRPPMPSLSGALTGAPQAARGLKPLPRPPIVPPTRPVITTPAGLDNAGLQGRGPRATARVRAPDAPIFDEDVEDTRILSTKPDAVADDDGRHAASDESGSRPRPPVEGHDRQQAGVPAEPADPGGEEPTTTPARVRMAAPSDEESAPMGETPKPPAQPAHGAGQYNGVAATHAQAWAPPSDVDGTGPETDPPTLIPRDGGLRRARTTPRLETLPALRVAVVASGVPGEVRLVALHATDEAPPGAALAMLVPLSAVDGESVAKLFGGLE